MKEKIQDIQVIEAIGVYYDNQVSTIVRVKRKELKLSQSELAEKIDLTKAGISKIECGGGISNRTIKSLNKALDLNIPLKPEPKYKSKKTLKGQIEELKSENIILKHQTIPRLKGEFIGTLEGILFLDIPEQLKEKLQAKIFELNENNQI